MPFLLTLLTSLQFVYVFFYKAVNPKQINASVFKSKKDESNLLEFPLLPWGVWRLWLARWWLSPTYCLQQDKSLSPHIKPVFKWPIVCQKRKRHALMWTFGKSKIFWLQNTCTTFTLAYCLGRYDCTVRRFVPLKILFNLL